VGLETEKTKKAPKPAAGGISTVGAKTGAETKPGGGLR
jgi:hypothetical protein